MWSTRWSLTVTWFILFRLSSCKYRASFTFYGIKCGKLTTDVSNQEWRGSCCYQSSSFLSNTPDPEDKNKERNGKPAEQQFALPPRLGSELPSAWRFHKSTVGLETPVQATLTFWFSKCPLVKISYNVSSFSILFGKAEGASPTYWQGAVLQPSGPWRRTESGILQPEGHRSILPSYCYDCYLGCSCRLGPVN